ncbi:hypothetical protein [Shewanella sp.]|uniref:hypothetical protein n=1 Tax=Shewanella sp. TaxID=50422 RepID=UPI003A96D343
MSQCEVTYGFFTMSACQEPAVATCPECQKEICALHWSEAQGRCMVCAAKELTPENASALSQGADNYNGFGMKQLYFSHDWYQNHRKHGSYSGAFSDADYAAFEQPLVEDADVDADDYQYRDIYDS